MKTKAKLIMAFAIYSNVALSQSLVSTGSLAQPRGRHEAHLLSNGKVLVFGGSDMQLSPGPPTIYTACELYTPGSGTWAATGSLNIPRDISSSVRLLDGRVLAIGGKINNNLTPTASCEIYTVANGTWVYTDSMAIPRYNHASVLLADGRVLVAGGTGVGFESEIYNPTTGLWSSAANMNVMHGEGMQMIRLQNGKILATGGDGAGVGNEAELYDPALNTWTNISAMTESREEHRMVMLQDGRVLIYGGDPAFQETNEIFNPATNTFTQTGDSDQDHAYCDGLLLSDGRVIVYGVGDLFSPGNTKILEIFNPATGTWSSPPSSTFGAAGAYTMVALLSNQILIAGGNVQTGNGANTSCFLISGVTAIGLNELVSENNGILVYPNPADEFLNIVVENLPAKQIQMRIADLSGKEMMVAELSEVNTLLDVSHLPAGMFIVSVYDQDALISQQKVTIR